MITYEKNNLDIIKNIHFFKFILLNICATGICSGCSCKSTQSHENVKNESRIIQSHPGNIDQLINGKILNTIPAFLITKEDRVLYLQLSKNDASLVQEKVRPGTNFQFSSNAYSFPIDFYTYFVGPSDLVHNAHIFNLADPTEVAPDMLQFPLVLAPPHQGF